MRRHKTGIIHHLWHDLVDELASLLLVELARAIEVVALPKLFHDNIDTLAIACRQEDGCLQIIHLANKTLLHLISDA